MPPPHLTLDNFTIPNEVSIAITIITTTVIIIIIIITTATSVITMFNFRYLSLCTL